MGRKPWLSVVLIVRDPADDPDAVLSALAAEPGISACEVICVDGRTVGSKISNPFSEDVLIRKASPGLSMPQLKFEGLRIARADAIGFLEPKGVPRAGWLAAANRALAKSQGGLIGGAVRFAGEGTAANQAAFIFEYGDLTPEKLASGSVRDLSGNNMILPREALLTDCADILATDGLNKPFCQARLLEAGHALSVHPDLQVELQSNHRALPLLRSRLAYGRCFGGKRARRASGSRRWAYRLGAPVVPAILINRHLRRMNMSTWPQAWRTRLALVSLCLAWSMGEGFGAWAGPGNACQRLY